MPRETPGTLLVMSYRETRLHGFERNDVYLVLLHWCESFSLGGVKISGVLLTTDSWAHHQQGHFQHCLKAQPKSASQNTCLTSSRPPGSCLCSLKCLHVCVFFFLIYFFLNSLPFSVQHLLQYDHMVTEGNSLDVFNQVSLLRWRHLMYPIKILINKDTHLSLPISKWSLFWCKNVQ